MLISEKNKQVFIFYFIIIFLWLFGETLIYVNPSLNFLPNHTLCLFKSLTGIACPGCGTGRGIQCIIHFQFIDAIKFNPLSLLVFIGTVIIPFWLIFDLIRKKISLFNAFKKFDLFMKQHQILFWSMILIFIANWLWNIKKF